MQHVFGPACSTHTRAVFLAMTLTLAVLAKPLSRQATSKETQVKGGKDGHQAYSQGSLVLINSLCARL